MRALRVFSVSYAGIRLRVRLLPSVVDVDAQYREGRRRRNGMVVHAYFQPSRSVLARYDGTVVFGMDSDLDETVPHEVAHAVFHWLQRVSAANDEPAATAIGILSARIFAEVRPIQRKWIA